MFHITGTLCGLALAAFTVVTAEMASPPPPPDLEPTVSYQVVIRD